jgi:hypothetical protein
MAGTAHADPGTGTPDGDGGVKEQAQEKAQEIREQAGEQARQAAGQARDRVREQLDERSTQTGRRVSEQAGDLRTVADQLRQQGKDGPAKIAEQVAERTEKVGSWMTESDADRIIADVEDFARRKPWAVAGGGLVLGFVASRLLKASSRTRYEQSSGRVPVDHRIPARTSAAPPIDRPLSTMPGAGVPATGEPLTGGGPAARPVGDPIGDPLGGSTIPVPPSASPADAPPPAVPVDPRGGAS